MFNPGQIQDLYEGDHILNQLLHLVKNKLPSEFDFSLSEKKKKSNVWKPASSQPITSRRAISKYTFNTCNL